MLIEVPVVQLAMYLRISCSSVFAARTLACSPGVSPTHHFVLDFQVTDEAENKVEAWTMNNKDHYKQFKNLFQSSERLWRHQRNNDQGTFQNPQWVCVILRVDTSTSKRIWNTTDSLKTKNKKNPTNKASENKFYFQCVVTLCTYIDICGPWTSS